MARKGQVGEGAGCWGFDTPSGKPRGFIYKAKDGQASVAQGQEAMAKDKWNHLAMAYDGKKIQIYLNGKVIGSQDTTGKINENDKAPVWIGKKANENIWLNGVMDDLLIFNVGLTGNEIKTYMNDGLTLAVSPRAKLAISWAELKH
ncbi:MAG: LamG domain-containing protein [Dehalococcoidia bacterium]|nr:LamG domain-containing protein [Dehalococcoidia bacterium]